MSKTYTGNAQAIAQVDSFEPGGVIDIGDTFTLTINGKFVRHTAVTGAVMVPDIIAGMIVAATAGTAPAEFADILWTDGTTVLLGTAATPGQPFTCTSTSGGATFMRAVVTVSNGPNDAGLAANWLGGVAPVSTDDLILDGLISNADILYGLSHAAIVLASLIVRNGYSGNVGLPEQNEAGGYQEYRDKYLKYAFASSAIVQIECQSQRFKFDFANSVVLIQVNDTGSPSEDGFGACTFIGQTGANTLEVNKGDVACAVATGTTTGVGALAVGFVTSPQSDATVTLGIGCALGTITMKGGTLHQQALGAPLTSLAIIGPATAYLATYSVITCTNYGGSIFWTGQLTGGGAALMGSYLGGDGSLLDTSFDTSSRTITSSAMYRGAVINDPNKTITWTNSTTTVDMRMSDLASSDFGKNFNFKIT